MCLFTFCTYSPKFEFKPISVSVHVGIRLALLLWIIKKNATANYILLKSYEKLHMKEKLHIYGEKIWRLLLWVGIRT